MGKTSVGRYIRQVAYSRSVPGLVSHISMTTYDVIKTWAHCTLIFDAKIFQRLQHLQNASDGPDVDMCKLQLMTL